MKTGEIKRLIDSGQLTGEEQLTYIHWSNSEGTKRYFLNPSLSQNYDCILDFICGPYLRDEELAGMEWKEKLTREKLMGSATVHSLTKQVLELSESRDVVDRVKDVELALEVLKNEMNTSLRG